LTEGLLAGRSGVGRWRDLDARVACRVGGDLSDFDFTTYLAATPDVDPELARRARRLLRDTPLAAPLTAAAALEAFRAAGDLAGCQSHRTAHVLGGHNLQLRYQFDNTLTFMDEPEFVAPLFGIKALDTDVLAVVCELLELRGPAMTVGAACASGNAALLAGGDLIRAGRADVVLVTGAAMALDPVWLQGWVILDAVAYASFGDEPWRASRPFDRRREGFVPSQGAAAVVLERADHAERRGADILAYLAGAASTSAATRSTRPELVSQLAAMRGALDDAGLGVSDVDYVNAHATSTPLGDRVEAEALRELLGPRVGDVPVNATKSMLGHCLTSASVLEAVAVVGQMRAGRLHPNLNLDEPEEELGLRLVGKEAEAHVAHVALSNAFGFGGINCCVVLTSPEVEHG
jgi:3-oxoacyl-(acyl-carrier-protein) synthase